MRTYYSIVRDLQSQILKSCIVYAHSTCTQPGTGGELNRSSLQKGTDENKCGLSRPLVPGRTLGNGILNFHNYSKSMRTKV